MATGSEEKEWWEVRERGKVRDYKAITDKLSEDDLENVSEEKRQKERK